MWQLVNTLNTLFIVCVDRGGMNIEHIHKPWLVIGLAACTPLYTVGTEYFYLAAN